jgi:hypothetical protein
MQVMTKPPEPILDLLKRLQIPYRIADDCLVIRMQDLEIGEARHQEQGNLFSQIYKTDLPDSLKEALQNTVTKTERVAKLAAVEPQQDWRDNGGN